MKNKLHWITLGLAYSIVIGCAIGLLLFAASLEPGSVPQPATRTEQSAVLDPAFNSKDNRIIKESRVRTIRANNAEDAKEGLAAAMKELGWVDQESGSRAPDVVAMASTRGIMIFGIVLGVLGALAWGLLNRIKVGLGLIACGAAVGLLPLIWQTIWPWVVGGGAVVLVGAVIWIMYDERNKNKALEAAQGSLAYFRQAIDFDNIGKMFTDNDHRAGGALAHIKMHDPDASPSDVAKAAMFKARAKDMGKPATN